MKILKVDKVSLKNMIFLAIHFFLFWLLKFGIGDDKISNPDLLYEPSLLSRGSQSQSKREKRLLQNRESASRLRVKKKKNMKQLAEVKVELEEENTELRNQV